MFFYKFIENKSERINRNPVQLISDFKKYFIKKLFLFLKSKPFVYRLVSAPTEIDAMLCFDRWGHRPIVKIYGIAGCVTHLYGWKFILQILYI